MGHEVFPLQENEVNSAQIIKTAFNSDLFFWVHTHGWMIDGMAEVIDILKESGIPTVGYHLDLWMGLKRFKDLETDPYWTIDYFFTVDKLFADFLNSDDRLPKAFFLPAGVFQEETYIADHNNEYEHDVVFTGSGIYHPEWPYRPKLIKWLHDVYGSRFAHYGQGGLGTIRGMQLNQLYSSSKVIIGDTLCVDFKYPYYLSDRIFETTGRNGFIIHPYILGIEDLFKIQSKTGKTNNAEIIVYPFNNFEYLQYLIDYFIVNNDERESIRKRGHERTIRDHTYTSRLEVILNTVINEQSRSKSDNSKTKNSKK